MLLLEEYMKTILTNELIKEICDFLKGGISIITTCESIENDIDNMRM